MTLTLDHVVIAVADLAAAEADYGALGFTVVPGGRHANGVTHNALVVLEDGAYLELIAWTRPDPGNRWFDVFQRAGEGLVDHALWPEDIAADVAAARARGLDIDDPVDGGRLRPDGERLAWRVARSPAADVPFLCGDVTPRGLRVQEGDVRRHPNGATGVAALTIAVHDLDASCRRYAALVGQGATRDTGSRTVGDAPARTAAFRLAGTEVVLASPTGRDGALAAALEARGEGPFEIAFRAGATDAIAPSLSHGARLSLRAE